MGKLAFVFPGQGAQYGGMGRELYDASAAARQAFDAMEAAMPGIQALCFSGGEEALGQTLNTQPALFAVGMAAAAALRGEGINADMTAGFSLGEMDAVTYAGMLPLEDGLRLTQFRAACMQECAKDNPGAMVAVLKLAPDQVDALAAGFERVYPVNYNSPAQTVVALAQEQVEPFTAAVKAAGGRAMRLNVSGAFHSPFMAQAQEIFLAEARKHTFGQPDIPVYANETAQPYAGDAAEQLARQMTHPVQWQKTVEAMVQDGCDTFIETGAGQVLGGLIKRIAPDVRILHVQDAQSLQETLDALKGVS